jgi:hypothetical protein
VNDEITAVTDVTTENLGVLDPPARSRFIGFQSLERERWQRGQYNVWNGAKLVIEIEIRKSQSGRDQEEQFSNRYLFSGSNDTTSDESEQTARNCAELESFMYPSDTNFVRAVIRRLDINSKVMKGNTRSFPLDLIGTFAIPANDTLAPSHVVATFERAAILGRPGASYYRNCVTAGEFEAWTNSRTVPARFDTSSFTLGGLINPVEVLMLTALGGQSLIPCLPDADHAGIDTPRPVATVRFAGLRLNDPNRPKGSAGVNMLKAAQQKINDLAARARYASRSDNLGNTPATAAQVIIDLKAKASKIYWDLEVEFRARIIWPAVFTPGPAGNVAD